MKKIKMVFLSFLLVFLLSSCVVDDGYTDSGNNDDLIDDEVIEDEVIEDEIDTLVPADILALIEAEVSGTIMFTTMEEAIDSTSIVNVYVGKNESDVAEYYVLRMVFMGRWADVDFMVIFDKTEDEIVSMVVIEEDENWGSFITLDSFLDQFIGKSIDFFLTNDVLLGVDGNSSATTTIGGINQSLEEAINYYKNNLE